MTTQLGSDSIPDFRDEKNKPVIIPRNDQRILKEYPPPVRESMESFHQKRLDRYFSNPKNRENYKNGTYGREMFYIVRAYQKELKPAYCPMSRTELMTHGIDWEPDVEKRAERVRADVTKLLMKLKTETYTDILRDVTDRAFWLPEETLGVVAEVILHRAINDSENVIHYADMVFRLQREELKRYGQGMRREIWIVLVSQAQALFESITFSSINGQTAKLEMKKNCADILDDQRARQQIGKLVCRIMTAEKKQMFALIKFLAHLYHVGFLGYSLIEDAILYLIGVAEKHNSDLVYEYALHFLQEVSIFAIEKMDRNQYVITDLISHFQQKQNLSDGPRALLLTLVEKIKSYFAPQLQPFRDPFSRLVDSLV